MKTFVKQLDAVFNGKLSLDLEEDVHGDPLKWLEPLTTAKIESAHLKLPVMQQIGDAIISARKHIRRSDSGGNGSVAAESPG